MQRVLLTYRDVSCFMCIKNGPHPAKFLNALRAAIYHPDSFHDGEGAYVSLHPVEKYTHDVLEIGFDVSSSFNWRPMTRHQQFDRNLGYALDALLEKVLVTARKIYLMPNFSDSLLNVWKRQQKTFPA